MNAKPKKKYSQSELDKNQNFVDTKNWFEEERIEKGIGVKIETQKTWKYLKRCKIYEK